jgi:murein DD-endopeptidase MepM/ murein hydrolase activator NlpD
VEAKRLREEKRQRAEQIKPAIQQATRQEERVLGELDELDRRRAARREELKRYQDEIAMTQAQLEAIRRQSRLTSDELARSAGRLRQDLLTWQTGSESDKAAIDHGDVALWCGAGEADRLLAARMTKFDLQLRSVRQAERLATLKRLRRGLAAKERELADAMRDRSDFLRNVRLEKSQKESLLREYEVSGRALDRVVERLADETRRAREAAVVPSTARVGQLLWPVKGPILRRFGRQKHEVFNATVFSTGIEIGAKEGTPVRAAETGKVAFLDWLTGYGRVMIVDHGSGFHTLYGHLQDAAVGVGSRVTRGAQLGTVGDTGSLGAASLYFEVRHHGQPADPRRYLGGNSE